MSKKKTLNILEWVKKKEQENDNDSDSIEDLDEAIKWVKKQ